jgi:AcrR family transcriptional regulator
MSPAQRREQLLDLGLVLLATRSFDELSIDVLAEEAGVSRGLLYHYFGSKQDFHEAVVRRAADDLIAQTAPPRGGDPVARLQASMQAYVDYVLSNYEGYVSLVKGAGAGNERLRAIHDEVRGVLTDRIFAEDAQGELVPDTAAARLLVRGWSAMVEDMVLSWRVAPGDVDRARLLDLVTISLPALVALLPPTP